MQAALGRGWTALELAKCEKRHKAVAYLQKLAKKLEYERNMSVSRSRRAVVDRAEYLSGGQASWAEPGLR